jgi:Zn-dependent protease
VNPSQLEGGRYGEAIVAIAGPISNLVLAIAAALPLRYILANPGLQEQIPFLVLQILFFFILINLVLMVFNLFPIPPLDGSKVLFAFLPPQVAWRWRPILEQYGFILLLIVFFLPPGGSIGGRILVPIIDGFLDLLVGR